MGDPTLLGWVTTVAYLASAVACARTAVVFRTLTDRRLFRLFAGCAVLMAALGFNKQLDLHSRVLAAGKAVVHGSPALLGHRGALHLLALLLAAVVGVAALVLIVRSVRGNVRKLTLVLCGLALLVVFGVGRASDFNHVLGPDELPTWALAPFELAGIALVLAGALTVARSAAAPVTPSGGEPGPRPRGS